MLGRGHERNYNPQPHQQRLTQLTLPNGLTIRVGGRVICKTGDEYFDGRPCLVFDIYKSPQDNRYYIAGELQSTTFAGPSAPRGSRFENVVATAVVNVL